MTIQKTPKHTERVQIHLIYNQHVLELWIQTPSFFLFIFFTDICTNMHKNRRKYLWTQTVFFIRKFSFLLVFYKVHPPIFCTYLYCAASYLQVPLSWMYNCTLILICIISGKIMIANESNSFKNCILAFSW